MDFINTSNCTPQDKAILMLMERIEQLEKELYDAKKENIIRNIASCGSKTSIWADIFMFLLGIDVPSRMKIRENHKLTKKYIPSIIPKRAIDLYHIQNTSKKPFWESDFDKDESFEIYSYEDSNNVYKILQNMSLKELEDYWHYRASWTKWLETI